MTLLGRLSLTAKMVLLTLLVGAATWYPLDAIHTRDLKALFEAQLMRRLEIEAQEDRLFFDQYLRASSQAARFFVAHERLSRYLSGLEAQAWTGAAGPVRIRESLPPWLPRAAVLRIFPLPRYALLLDPAHRVREVYQAAPEPPPAGLLAPGNLLAQLSHTNGLMTNVDGRPYVLSYEPVRTDDGRERGALMLASPLDSELLRSSQKPGPHDRLVLLIKDDRVIASSRPEVIAPDTSVAALKHRYVIVGKSFFDYGVSDLLVEFASVRALAEVESLSRAVLNRERAQRAITAALLVAAFLVLTLWISRYVRAVTRGMVAFSRDTLGVEPRERTQGDELRQLDAEFRALAEEVVHSREALSRAVEDRIRTELDAAQQARTVAVLREATDALAVGILQLHDGNAAPQNGLMERFLACGRDQFLPAPGKDEEVREIECRGATRTFELHRLLADLVLVREVTHEREMRSRLRLALDLIENSTQGMFVADAGGAILLINAALTRMTGVRETDLADRGPRFLPLVTDEPAARAAAVEKLRANGRFEGELRIRAPGGGEQVVWLRADAVRDEHGRVTHYAGILSDVTERHRAQQRLARYAEELRVANEEMKNFAYIVSHDLRAPLVNVKGFVSELRTDVGELRAALRKAPGTAGAETLAAREADIDEALGFIDSSVKKMDGLIQAILALSRLGRRELRPQPIDTRALVEEQLGALRFQIEQRGCEVIIGPLPPLVADRTAMEMVFGNLLSNAVKYLEPARPGRIEVRGEQHEDELLFHVRDNGRGIARGDYPKIFAIFRRAGNQDVPGEGIGLTFVQTLLRRHGGKIWFESDPGVGSTFSFQLPKVPPAELMKGDERDVAA